MGGRSRGKKERQRRCETEGANGELDRHSSIRKQGKTVVN
jgi:hypothetical protein